MSSLDPLILDNVRLLRQGIALLEELSDELYTAAEPRVSTSGIGGHVRHCIDYYTCLLRDAALGHVDYDDRQRDGRIETERAHAVRRLVRLAGELEAFRRSPGELPLMVKMDCQVGDEHAPRSRSSLGRELHMLLSHTVHHYAFVAVILRLNGIEPPEGFGVAPSTLHHWEATGTCAH